MMMLKKELYVELLSEDLNFTTINSGNLSFLAVVNVLFMKSKKMLCEDKEFMERNLLLYLYHCCPNESILQLESMTSRSYKFSYIDRASGKPVIRCVKTRIIGFTCNSTATTNHSVQVKLSSHILTRVVDATNLETLSKETVCTNGEERENGSCQHFLKVSLQLHRLVRNISFIKVKNDVRHIAMVLHQITSAAFSLGSLNETTAIEVNKHVFETLDIMLGSNKRLIAKSEQDYHSSTSIVESIERLVSAISNIVRTTNRPMSIGLENVAMNVASVPPKDYFIVAQETTKNSNITIKNERNTADETTTATLGDSKTLVKVFLPKEIFKGSNQVVSIVIQRKDTLFQTTMTNTIKNTSGISSNLNSPCAVSSNLLTLKVANEKVTNLISPIVLSFKQQNFSSQSNADNKKDQPCRFWKWNSSTTASLHMQGEWRQDGCYVDTELSTLSEIVCKCHHLTTFATLMNVLQEKTAETRYLKELEIVTKVGCYLSLFGLLFTIISSVIFKDIRKKLPFKILTCLSVSLAALLLTFSVGVENSGKSQTSCIVVAVLIHYFMLTTFCWMGVDGLNLYRYCVAIFRTGSSNAFFLRASFFAWGVPAAIVGTMATIKREDFGNDQLCIVTGNTFHFAVMLPICFLIVVNFFILIMVMRSLTRGQKIPGDLKRSKEDILKQCRTAFAVSLLLGTTWVFGVLAVGELKEVFQWLFTVFNAFQGFFIFIFHIVRNESIRKKWISMIRREANALAETLTTDGDNTINQMTLKRTRRSSLPDDTNR